MADGGELFVGLKPGVRREDLARALTGGGVAECLNRFEARAGDFFFIPARTIHALGQGCLIYEVQQTCDVTFRVHDWDRLGLDGKPRALHVTESLETIDFDAPPATVIRHLDQPHPAGGEYRPLVTCPYFHVEERSGLRITGDTEGRPVILTGLSGQGTISTRDGSTDIAPWQTVVIPAAAGVWNANTQGEPLRVLCATTVNQG
jgi:mannose-6-phosphate isomerase